jgi:hypothetical protein
MDASAKDGACNGGGGVKAMRVRYEVTRHEINYRGEHMAEGNKRRVGRRRDIMGTF